MNSNTVFEFKTQPDLWPMSKSLWQSVVLIGLHANLSDFFTFYWSNQLWILYNIKVRVIAPVKYQIVLEKPQSFGSWKWVSMMHHVVMLNSSEVIGHSVVFSDLCSFATAALWCSTDVTISSAIVDGLPYQYLSVCCQLGVWWKYLHVTTTWLLVIRVLRMNIGV